MERVLGAMYFRGFTRGAWRMQTIWWRVAARQRANSSCWRATRTGPGASCSGRSRAATGGLWRHLLTSSCHPFEVRRQLQYCGQHNHACSDDCSVVEAYCRRHSSQNVLSPLGIARDVVYQHCALSAVPSAGLCLENQCESSLRCTSGACECQHSQM